MGRRYLGFAALVLVAIIITTAIFFYAKGYRINLTEKTIAGTGIIQITTRPKGAAVLIDGEASPKQATDVNLTGLRPNKYKITLKKNGFIDWTKEVEVRAGLVSPVDALLFPAAPNLKAVTFTGVINPQISPDNQKLVYAVDTKDKAGLWVLDLSDRPLFFSKDPKQIIADSANFTFSTSTFQWTPDSKSILVTVTSNGTQMNFMLDSGTLNQQLNDISARVVELKSGWLKDATVKNNDRLNTLGSEAKKLAEGAKKIIFSPEEERVLIVQADNTAIVYDSKPYTSFDKKPLTFILPKAESYIWYPESSQSGHDSRHLFLIRKESISIIESDGSNEMTLYTGAFIPTAVFPWPNGSKLLISTSLNSSISKESNLYSIDLSL